MTWAMPLTLPVPNLSHNPGPHLFSPLTHLVCETETIPQPGNNDIVIKIRNTVRRIEIADGLGSNRVCDRCQLALVSILSKTALVFEFLKFLNFDQTCVNINMLPGQHIFHIIAKILSLCVNVNAMHAFAMPLIH